ncbi:MAG: hypothetical protein HEQ27_05915 [Dolichospermum sp. JUN01]|jgi:hypothetical protein|uniref:hypothetical protein n=1 Tax=Anabaena sp. WA102 TaxID=1647413 RepID=UPI0006AC516C|nr:hypothetical protein [Anabaena sp. WA102]ALB41805.1 hypothetical protein AA650_16260 [Anabaena sp. WA102]MBO1056072.1 hypothetical protein [Dolichospermum sp. JUN01]
MNKSFLSRVILSSLAFSTLAILPNQAVIAQKNPQKPASFWSNISQLLFSNKPPVKPRKGGSRPIDSICIISPDAPSETRIIWSDRPLFAWQGKARKIQLTDLNNNTVIFSENVENTQQYTYTGEPLQPGQTYKLDIFIGDGPAVLVEFQIMESEERDRITAALKTLENKLQAKKSHHEAIAFAKANYFTKLGLWSDVLQQAYSVQKPSPELDRMLKEIPKQLCTQPKSDRL